MSDTTRQHFENSTLAKEPMDPTTQANILTGYHDLVVNMLLCAVMDASDIYRRSSHRLANGKTQPPSYYDRKRQELIPWLQSEQFEDYLNAIDIPPDHARTSIIAILDGKVDVRTIATNFKRLEAAKEAARQKTIYDRRVHREVNYA